MTCTILIIFNIEQFTISLDLFEYSYTPKCMFYNTILFLNNYCNIVNRTKY